MPTIRKHKKALLKMLAITALIVLVSFPKIHPDFSASLDGSYMWALNYLLHQNYDALRQMLYPFGPLGFLKHPVVIADNLAIALFFSTVVKLAFVFQLLLLGYLHKHRIHITHILVALLAAFFTNFDIGIIGGCVLSLLLFYRTRFFGLFIWAVLLAGLGLFIKVSIGINAGAVVVVFLLIDLYYTRDGKKTVGSAAIGAAVLLVVGLLVFRDVDLLFSYLFNSIRLATGFGDALSLHPENNWKLLGIFILSILLAPVLFRHRQQYVAYGLLLLPLFATWKHAMAREDSTHVRLLLLFLVVFWCIIWLVSTEKKVRLLLLAVVSVFVFNKNLYNVPGFDGYKINRTEIRNFTESVIHYKQFRNEYRTISVANIQSYKLDSVLLAKIGNSTIDFYPWDFGFVPANNLNFSPRTTLQSGALATWYDLEEAANFTPQTGPEFVLLHLSPDRNGNWFGNYDNRHLFNDEPHTIYNLLNYYTIAEKRSNLLLLKKTTQPNLTNRSILATETHQLNHWIEVPAVPNSFVRARANINGNLLYALKSFLFKGEQFYVDYQLSNGSILTYRFGNANAKDGLWVNPFFTNPNSPVQEPEVARIRFRSTNNKLLKNEITVSWETFALAATGKKQGAATHPGDWFFGKTKPYNQTVLLSKSTGFEPADTVFEVAAGNLRTWPVFTGKYAYAIPPQGFSTAISVAADSIFAASLQPVELEIEVWYNMGEGEAQIVTENTDKQNHYWKGQTFRKAERPEKWAVARQKLAFARGEKVTGTIRAYIWNTSPDTVYIDNFRLEVKNKTP